MPVSNTSATSHSFIVLILINGVRVERPSCDISSSVCSTMYGSPNTVCIETGSYQAPEVKKPPVPPYYGTPQTEPGVTENDKR